MKPLAVEPGGGPSWGTRSLAGCVGFLIGSSLVIVLRRWSQRSRGRRSLRPFETSVTDAMGDGMLALVSLVRGFTYGAQRVWGW